LNRAATQRRLVNEEPDIAPFRTLVIGDIARWQERGHDMASCENFMFSASACLTVDMMREFAPDMVLSPLIGDSFDVIDVASMLRQLGFDGCYRVIAPVMPHADVIRADVAAVAPELDFDLIMLPEAVD